MRIAIDARMYGKGVTGIGTYVQNLTDYIFQLDQNNDYYLFLLPENFDKFNPPHSKIHKIKTTAKWYSYQEQTQLLFELNKYKFDLVHFPHFNAPIFYNRPRIHTIHDITPKFFPGHKQKSWYRKKAYELTIKTGLKKSKIVITDAENTKKDLIEHFQLSSAKIAVVNLGIENEFKVSENYDKIKEVRAKYQISKPFIFYTSAWRSHKNFEGLIQAFDLFKKQTQLDYQLVLGGEEDPFYLNISKEIAKAESKKDIIAPGFIPDTDLPLIYNAASLYVFPSFYEGFGFTGLEAMACGTPVISSNRSCLPEIYEQAALYFDPENIAEITAQMKKVLTDQDLEQELITKGFQQIKKYSWQQCAQQTLAIYQQALKQ